MMCNCVDDLQCTELQNRKENHIEKCITQLGDCKSIHFSQNELRLKLDNLPI